MLKSTIVFSSNDCLWTWGLGVKGLAKLCSNKTQRGDFCERCPPGLLHNLIGFHTAAKWWRGLTLGASENSLIWPLCLSEEKMEREIEQRVQVPAVMRRELSLFLTESAVKYLRGRGQQGEMSFLVLENDVQRFILALKPRSFSESQRIFLMSLILKKMLTFFSERQESMLKGRFSPAGQIEGFTAEIGASGSYCPQHVTLPVQVTYYDISEHSAPSPFLVSLCFWVFTCAWIPLTTP